MLMLLSYSVYNYNINWIKKGGENEKEDCVVGSELLDGTIPGIGVLCPCSS